MAARERTIPNAPVHVQDFGLNVTPPPQQRNKRIVVLGTAEDGPMYEPLLVDKPEDAEFVWGRNGAGDLVRGVYEAWDVQTGYPTVVGVRIGNGEKAELEISESSGSGDDAPQPSETTALTLTARYPGQIYNQVTVGYDDDRRVAIYNPKTGLTSTFSVDTEHPNNTNVDVHDVDELVDAINNDRNASQVVVASYEPVEADYEVAISGTSTGVNQNSAKVTLSLEDLVSNGYVTTDGYMVPDPYGSGVTGTNNIIELQTVESVSVSEWENLGNKSSVSTKFSLSPLDGKGESSWDTIQSLHDYDGDEEWMHDISGNVVSEYIYSLTYEYCDGGNGEGGPTASGGYDANNTFRISVPLCLDDSEETESSGVASGYINGLIGTTYAGYNSDWTQITTQGIEPKEVNGNDLRPSGKISVYVSTDSDINGFWTELPFSENSGVYLKEYDSANEIATFGIGSGIEAGSVSGVMRKLVNEDGTIKEDRYLRVSAYSVKGLLGEVETLPELEDAGSSTLQTYFVRGDEVLFNKAPAFDMIVNYGTRITYEPGSTVSLSDPDEGYVSFATEGLLPGPGGRMLSDNKVSYIRFKYTYMPQWPDITSAAQALDGGTDGNVLSDTQRYDEFTTAYSKLRNYEADIWVPMGAYIDATAEKFNPITGLKETVPVGYHTQLEDFLDDLSINARQPSAILGVTPMEEVTQENKDDWVDALTVTDDTDTTRGANIMNIIGNKFMNVVAFEPVFLNIGRGSPYSANGQAAYAGMIAALPHDVSPMNKTIRGIRSLRFSLSVSQIENLNAMRYVTMQALPGRSPFIVEDKTAAPIGSDYQNWSVFNITAEASNRVKAVAREFIGRPNSVEVRTSLDQAISNTLSTMGGLRAFDFSLNSTPNQQVLGVVEVDLTLVPIFTIKIIRTTVKLRKKLPTT